MMQQMIINLWFTNQAEEAADFYCSVFADSKINAIARFPEAGQDITGGVPGSVLTVSFSLNGMEFIALNGGEAGFSFNESISIMVNCDTQEEIDHYWNSLTADGGQEVQCGWLKDKYGVAWQVASPRLDQLLASDNKDVANRVMEAMLKMKKIDIAALEAAAQEA